MKIALRVLAGLALILIVACGLVAGLAVLPVRTVHVQHGAIPNGHALQLNIYPGVHLRVVSTAEAGGKPRYEYRMTSMAEPLPNPVEEVGTDGDRFLDARCVSTDWADALGQRCHGELLVVVKAGRPIHPYCYGDRDVLKPFYGEDVFIEEDYCNR